MGTDVADEVETARKPLSFEVHHLMCTDLMKLVDRISRILPEIEEARPRCSTGIQALCLLNGGIEKAKKLLQYCSDCSKLYLAFTGEVIVSRCQRSRDSLEQSLRQIQNWLPVMLVVKISQIADDLKDATFMMDPAEKEVGRVVRELLHQGATASNSRKDAEIKALLFASLRLNITSSKAILIEKRSIKKLREKVGDSDSSKKQILTYFLYLLKKYGNLLTQNQMESALVRQQGSFVSENSGNRYEHNQYADIKLHVGYCEYEAQSKVLDRAVPPEEFLCGMSSRLMYDPVVIASGQTYERMWIQKWFDEGHDTCPKTNMKLPHLSLTPNVAMKELTSRWCTKYGLSIPDPSMQPEALQSWETSCTSIASLGSSMNDLRLQMDFSGISFGSLDASYNSDSSRTKMGNGLNLVQSDDVSPKYKHAKEWETDLEFLSKLGELQWESRCKVVEDVKNHLNCNPQAYYSMSSKNFVEPLIKFLKDAHDQDDVKAQNDGLTLLLNFVSKNRNDISYLREEAYSLLASYLDSKVNGEVLAIMEVVSDHQYCRSKILESGALTSILKLLDSQIGDLQGQAIKILYNLSSSRDICSKIVSLEGISRLVSLVKDGVLTGKCISVLKNLCDTEEGRISIAETNGCIASVADILDNGSSEDQEHAVAILLSLCSQREEYCRLAMHEGVVPSLVSLSINGKDRARNSASEVLRLLRDVNYVDDQECSVSDLDASRDNSNPSNGKKSSKAGFFGKKMLMFSRPSSVAPKNKK